MNHRVACPMLLAVAGCAVAASHAVRPLPAASPASHASHTGQAAPLAIDAVGVEPKTVDAASARRVTFRYTLTQPASVSIDLVDEDGRVLDRLSGGQQAAGPRRITWDGRVDGRPAPNGAYRYVIIAEGDGRRAVYDPSAMTGGEELLARDFHFDPKTGILEFVLPKAGYARLRAGIEGFPHLRTLMDWTPMEAGRHTRAWDGLDASGLVRLSEHPKLSIKLTAFALPDNAVIVANSPTATRPSTAAPAYPPATKAEGYLHARHRRADCGDARCQLEFPGAATDAGGRPRLSGQATVRVTLDPADAPRMVNRRFEVVVYEDLTVLFEDEESTNPFTFAWDTTRLPPGEHLLTINLLSYDDHYALATVPVVIDAPGP